MLIGLLLLSVLFRFHDSLSKENRLPGESKERFVYYKEVLGHRKFMYFVLIQVLGMGVMFSYIASSPLVFQEHYHLTRLMYSICFACNAVAIMLGSLSVVRFRSNEHALRVGVCGFMFLCCCTGAALCLELSVIIIEIVFFLFLFFLGIICRLPRRWL